MRRSAGLGLLAGLLAAPGAAGAPLDLTVHRIESFSITGASLPGGPLEFLGGLDLSASEYRFGGFSGIEMIDDENAFLVSDAGSFVRLALVHENGKLAGVAAAEIDSLFPEGDISKQAGDAEDIAFDPQDPQRGVIVRERQANAMLAFEMKDGRPANFEPRTVGAENRLLRSNKGLESVAYAPAASPIAGRIVAIAEQGARGEENIPAWIAGVGAFEIVEHDSFDVSSARFLPDGDLLLLERRYTPGWGIAMRLRRIEGSTIAVGARVDGEYLLDVGMAHQIDNMEGLAVHRDQAGRTILTIVSDDNHSILQRTLLLQFALSED